MFVLGLDGLSHSLLEELLDRGTCPHLADFVSGAHLHPIRSVHPPVSTVAWTSFLTGVDPGGHGIFGFLDRQPSPFRLYLADARHRRGTTIWERLETEDKRSLLVNVPGTSPPGELNGVCVGGFLSADSERVVFPEARSTLLEEIGYVVDVDPEEARKQPGRYLEKIDQATRRRFDLATRLLEEETWDYFQLNIMETDRLCHFFLEERNRYDSPHRSAFFDFFQQLDRRFGELRDRLPESAATVVVSEHGMCELKRTVSLNVWLRRNDYLQLSDPSSQNVESMTSETRAYSLIPGRIYLNLKGREERGSVVRSERRQWMDRLRGELMAIRDPESDEPVLRAVHDREEIYSGPHVEAAPDLVAVPENGYDLRGDVSGDPFNAPGHMQGTHTVDDAFLASDLEELQSVERVQDVAGVLLEHVL